MVVETGFVSQKASSVTPSSKLVIGFCWWHNIIINNVTFPFSYSSTRSFFTVSMVAYTLSLILSHHISLLHNFLRYLKRIIIRVLHYTVKYNTTISTNVDAHFAASKYRKLKSGHIHFIYGSPFAWSSITQPSPPLSTCEAEYM